MWHTQQQIRFISSMACTLKENEKNEPAKRSLCIHTSPTACFTIGFFGDLACGLKPVPWMMEPHTFSRSDAISGSVDM